MTGAPTAPTVILPAGAARFLVAWSRSQNERGKPTSVLTMSTKDSPLRYTAIPRPVLWLVPEGPGIDPFYLSTLPVTNRQLEAFDPGFARSAASLGDDDPALGIDLEAARAYCQWYSRVARKEIRLPSEGEWEHACAAGRGQVWPWGEEWSRADEEVWHGGNSAAASIPDLRTRRSNPFGLYSMLGGVWEWVEGGEGHGVLRGGCWRMPAEAIARGHRRGVEAGTSVAEAGFRIAKSLRG
jgi:formylglycine-generating enzyme required for sulfatase activity